MEMMKTVVDNILFYFNVSMCNTSSWESTVLYAIEWLDRIQSWEWLDRNIIVALKLWRSVGVIWNFVSQHHHCEEYVKIYHYKQIINRCNVLEWHAVMKFRYDAWDFLFWAILCGTIYLSCVGHLRNKPNETYPARFKSQYVSEYVAETKDHHKMNRKSIKTMGQWKKNILIPNTQFKKLARKTIN